MTLHTEQDTLGKMKGDGMPAIYEQQYEETPHGPTRSPPAHHRHMLSKQQARYAPTEAARSVCRLLRVQTPTLAAEQCSRRTPLPGVRHHRQPAATRHHQQQAPQTRRTRLPTTMRTRRRRMEEA